MPNSLVQSRPCPKSRSRLVKGNPRSAILKNKKVDAATLASTLQLQEERLELIYSLMALFLKAGLLTLCSVSLIKLGLASHQRLVRHAELSSVLDVETVRLKRLQKRFDHLFTIGGDKRLIDEQDQWIAPNRVRVIWH